MYLTHYGYKNKPFEISSDPEFLWLGPKHAKALNTLKNGIMQNRGFVLLTGDVGTGKTTMINAFRRINDVATIIVTIPDPDMEPVDFFNFLADAFKMDKKFANKEDFIFLFKGFLLRAYAAYTKVLIIIDEAQRLNHQLLEEIRSLAVIEMAGRRLLKIFFVGQTEFNETLMAETNTAVRKEIVAGYHIEPLTEIETGQYIRHRIQVAGAGEDIFSKQCRRKIHAITDGFPRLINILCDHMLLTGYVNGASRIEADVIERCVKNNELPISLTRPPAKENPAIPDWNENKAQITPIKSKPRARWIWIILITGLILGSAGYLVSDGKAFDYLYHLVMKLFGLIGAIQFFSLA